MTYFVLTYDREADHANVEPFADVEEAFLVLKRLTIGKDPKREVVLFVSDSEEALRKTHSRYFLGEREMIDNALAILSGETPRSAVKA